MLKRHHCTNNDDLTADVTRLCPSRRGAFGGLRDANSVLVYTCHARMRHLRHTPGRYHSLSFTFGLTRLFRYMPLASSTAEELEEEC